MREEGGGGGGGGGAGRHKVVKIGTSTDADGGWTMVGGKKGKGTGHGKSWREGAGGGSGGLKPPADGKGWRGREGSNGRSEGSQGKGWVRRRPGEERKLTSGRKIE